MGQLEFRDDIKSQEDLDDKGVNGKYVGETFREGGIYYAADGWMYDDTEGGGGRAIADGRVKDVGEVKITPKSVIAERNLDAARTRLGEAENDFWGRYAIGLTAGGSLGYYTGSLTMAYNLGSGKLNFFGTYGTLNLPSAGTMVQINFMNAYGTVNGQKFKDVFGGMVGESKSYSGSYLLGFEHAKSSQDGEISNFGTATTSINLKLGYGAAVANTTTYNLSKMYYGFTPQFD